MDQASDGWLKAYALCSVITATLSIVGSTIILRRIHQQGQRINDASPYTHLMMALSISDIFASFHYALMSFLDPQQTSTFSWAIGNEQTCIASGFLSQLALIPLFYNAILSSYYMLTIRFEITERTFAKYWEPVMHLIAICYPTATAIYLLVGGHYGDMDNDLSCWIQDSNVAWAFVGIPVVLIFVVIVANNFTIYCFVRQRVRQSARHHLNHAPGQSNLQNVATMAFLYVGTFLITYIWAYITSILQAYSDQDEYTPLRLTLRLFYHIFHPLQGFWNALVFCRARYLHYRKDMEQKYRRQQAQQSDEQRSSDMMVSSEFYGEDEVGGAPLEHDTTIAGALYWAMLGPETLPNSRPKTSPNTSAGTVNSSMSFVFKSLESMKARSSTMSSLPHKNKLETENPGGCPAIDSETAAPKSKEKSEASPLNDIE